MKWYKRLFWKIFASIWGVSFLVLAGAVILLSLFSEKERIKEVTLAKADGYAQLMVRKYEQKGFETVLPALPRHRHGGASLHDKQPPEWGRPSKRDGKFKRHLFDIAKRVSITDLALNKPVVTGPGLPAIGADIHSFTYVSDLNRSYRVLVDLSWKSSPFARLLSMVLSVQVLLVLLVSGLAALLVSWIIVKPLNQLRQHVQAITHGELDRRTDETLHQRGDELGELAKEFDQMADYIQQTIASHQSLMQDVSHELRAPLARLQAATGLAEQKMGQEDKVVNRIQRECERLDQLIGEILSLSRLEQESRQGRSFLLKSLLDEMLDDARFTYPKRKFNLEVDAQYEVKINQKLLERALNNVLTNACKHTEEDVAVDINVDCTQGCLIRLRDHGKGVSEEQLSQLCDPFFRVNNQTNGYGLGLSIAKRAIERLGGELHIRNHPEGGLEVSLEIPAES